jgi:hypothetical protein
MTDITPNNPPCPAYRGTNKESFAYDTVVRRWPIILESAITNVKQTIAEEKNSARGQEGVRIIEAIGTIKKELVEDQPLRYGLKKASFTLCFYILTPFIDFSKTTNLMSKSGMRTLQNTFLILLGIMVLGCSTNVTFIEDSKKFFIPLRTGLDMIVLNAKRMTLSEVLMVLFIIWLVKCLK